MAGSFAKKFMVGSGKSFSLAKISPRDESAFASKDKAKAQIKEDAEAINALQDKLYAEGERSLIVVLQGMDCSGKDGTARVVFNACGPTGVEATAFKVPSAEELAHDFLWRVHKACPRKGMIAIFNRSHYEDVLVVKVKKLVKPEVIERRYEEINHFEKLLSDSGTRILKFMLHISKDEQAERLRERVNDPNKRWKFNPSDLADRKLWDDYQAAYEAALTRCSTHYAPWHVIPADRNWARNAAVARIVRETLEEMAPTYPPAHGWDPKTVVIE